jgi:uncharacterized protein YodC (DUF2158 family)
MTILREGDLVVLKSGGPTMTVDAVNTSVFDDNKITGVSCVWFVGDKLQRVRFDLNAIEPARIAETAPVRPQASAEDGTGEYKESLDVMIAAMNIPADAAKPAPEAMSIKPRRGSEKKSARNGAVIEASRKRREPKAPMN